MALIIIAKLELSSGINKDCFVTIKEFYFKIFEKIGSVSNLSKTVRIIQWAIMMGVRKSPALSLFLQSRHWSVHGIFVVPIKLWWIVRYGIQSILNDLLSHIAIASCGLFIANSRPPIGGLRGN